MKKHLSLILLCLLSVSITCFAQLPSLVAKIEKAVFQIETYDEYGLTYSSGTGFFIDKNGTGLTAYHVIENSKFAFVKDLSGKKYRIKKINRINLDADLAEFVLDTKETNFPFIPLANNIPAKGTEVFTIGNPEGFEFIVSNGIVSGLKTNYGNRIIQTSTPISSGSSGGPLLNMQGQAIGVISYFSTIGQNLNFAYSILERQKMKNDSMTNLMSDVTGNFYWMNIKSKHEPNLILNSIELLDSITVLNFSYANLSIAKGNEAFVYCNTKNRDETFFIQGKDSLTKYYIKNSTLSETIEDAPIIKLGQAVHFNLIFDTKMPIKSFDLKENMKGSDWSFHDINIPKKQYLTSEVFEQYKKNQFHETRMKLRREEYKRAKDSIDEQKHTVKNNELLEQMSAIASYSLGNYDEAIESIKNMIKLNPTNAGYYADLYNLYLDMDSTTKALDNINLAIQYNADYIEYYYMRAEINYKLQKWKECIKDYDKYLNSGRKEFASVYLTRGIAKAMIKDDGACTDLEKAKDLAESDREWEKINKEYRKYCKSFNDNISKSKVKIWN